jgi:hypothetical protein
MNPKQLLLATAATLTLLAGCGSGSSGGSDNSSGGTTPTDPTVPDNQNKKVIISGVVAQGAPLNGAIITVIGRTSTGLIDTSQTGTTANADGSFTLSVPATWKAPLLFQATANVGDKTVVLHSIYGDNFETTTSRQTINITSFTEAIFAAAVGQKPASFYSDMNTADTPDEGTADLQQMAALTKNLIDSKQVSLRTALAPLLSNTLPEIAPGTPARPDSVNLITTAFSANHTGLDKALDMTNSFYSGDRSKLLLTNKADQSNGVIINLNSQAISGTMPATAADTIETINQLPTQMTSMYATAVPASSEISKLVASNYLNNGVDATELTSSLQDSNYAKATFSINKINGIYLTGSDYHYDVLFKVKLQDGVTSELRPTSVYYNKSSKQWQFIGNGRLAKTDILSFYSNNFTFTGQAWPGSQASSAGLILRIEQPSISSMFAKATVSGPGINGDKPLWKSNLTGSDGTNVTGCAVLSLHPNSCQNRVNFDQETDFINKEFGFKYVVKLYRNAGDPSPIETFTVQLPIKPYLSTDALPTLAAVAATVSTSGGGSATSPTLTTAASYSGGDLPIYWTVNALDSSYQYFVGMDIDQCISNQVSTVQAAESASYSDELGNRLITFTTDPTLVKTTQGGYQNEYRHFPTTQIANPVRRDLRVFAQDEYNRVYYSSYTNSVTPASCQ